MELNLRALLLGMAILLGVLYLKYILVEGMELRAMAEGFVPTRFPIRWTRQVGPAAKAGMLGRPQPEIHPDDVIVPRPLWHDVDTRRTGKGFRDAYQFSPDRIHVPGQN